MYASDMTRVSVEEAAGRLHDLVDMVSRGEDVVLTRGPEEVARLVGVHRRGRQRKSGSLAGLVRMRSDFDEPLPGFEDHGS